MNQVQTSPASTTGFVIKLTVVAALGGFLFGYDTAVVSGVIPFITTKFALTEHLVGYAVSSAIVGCIIGSFSAGPISDSLGRKKVLIFTAVLFAISSIDCISLDICIGGKTRIHGPAVSRGHRTRVSSIPVFCGRHLAGIWTRRFSSTPCRKREL